MPSVWVLAVRLAGGVLVQLVPSGRDVPPGECDVRSAGDSPSLAFFEAPGP